VGTLVRRVVDGVLVGEEEIVQGGEAVEGDGEWEDGVIEWLTTLHTVHT
jgi:hypothetical protein